MKSVSLNYFPVRVNHSAANLDFMSMDDLVRFINSHQLKDVFLLQENEVNYFGVFYNNVLMRHATLGFKTIEDHQNADTYHFPDATIYYKAIAAGYNKYEDYDLVQQAGITDKAIFDKMKATKFIEGYKDYGALLQSDMVLPETTTFSNAYELYSFATQNGFDNYEYFKKAFTKGFTSADIFTVATSLGFDNHSDYNEALQKNFRTYEELQFAREKKVRDRNDFSRLIDLEYTNCKDCTYDKKVLLVLLSKIEQGKRISINKLKDLLKKSIEAYRYTDTMEMPLWFSTSLHNEEQIISFLLKDEQVKEYGSYDTDGEFFEMNRLQDRKVVIDGSNVAHNSNGNGSTKPYIANILRMINFLKSKGFTEVTVINDASLKHRLVDMDRLTELKEVAEYMEAPKENPADIFIIQYVKRFHCLLVSNDTFREWKVQDPWIADNIDFYRLSFMIKGEDVLMPDLN
ncbi:hypothetical protein BH11BAC6_BH11BAC6_12850 [soil metagenome]